MSTRMASYSSVLGVVVANKRKALGLEQSTIAERIGLSQASYSRLESGKSTFTVDQLFELAEALGVSASKLFNEVENTADSLRQNEDVEVTAPPRGNATKARGEHSQIGTFIAGAALGAIIIGLAGRSK